MTTWHEYYSEYGHAPEWPYTIRYGEEQEIETDVLIIGGGILIFTGSTSRNMTRPNGINLLPSDSKTEK